MVNNKNVSAFDGLPPECGAFRKIAASPLYDRAHVFALLESEASLKAWTEKCVADTQKYGLEHSHLAELVKLCLDQGRFCGAEWCKQAPSGPWAACDAYVVRRREWVEKAYKEIEFEYYIKFAISKTGKILLLASCHLSEDR